MQTASRKHISWRQNRLGRYGELTRPINEPQAAPHGIQGPNSHVSPNQQLRLTVGGRISSTSTMIPKDIPASHPVSIQSQPDCKSNAKIFHTPDVSQVCEIKRSNFSTLLDLCHTLSRALLGRSIAGFSHGDHVPNVPRNFKVSFKAIPLSISWSTSKWDKVWSLSSGVRLLALGCSEKLNPTESPHDSEASEYPSGSSFPSWPLKFGSPEGFGVGDG